MSRFIRNANPYILFHSMVANVGLEKTKEIFSYYDELIKWAEKEKITDTINTKPSVKVT